MSELVEECRREWKRLGVSETAADEMAAELLADLHEAEAEGGSAADVLGAAASDPRTFAASWAIERGVVPPGVAHRAGRRSRTALAAFVTVAALVMIGAAAAILAWESGAPTPVGLPDPPSSEPLVVEAPPTGAFWVTEDGRTLQPWAIRVPPAHDGDDLDPVAWLLLGVGVLSLVPAGALWFSRSRGSGPVAPA